MPLYYGSEEVFRIFNRDALIWLDPKNPQPAFARIIELEKNPHAYLKMKSQKLLAVGALQKYFSWTRDVGGGELQSRIRQLVDAS